MKLEAISRARESYIHLRDAFAHLKRDQHVGQVEKYWGEMLHYSDQIFNRLGHAPENGKERNWYNQELAHRDKDPLLRYVKQARNSEHHGIRQSTERTGSGDILRPSFPGNLGDPPAAPEVPLRLVPLHYRGVEFPIPTEFLGRPVRDPSVHTIAMLLEMSARALIQQAEYMATGKFR